MIRIMMDGYYGNQGTMRNWERVRTTLLPTKAVVKRNTLPHANDISGKNPVKASMCKKNSMHVQNDIISIYIYIYIYVQRECLVL